MKNIFRVSYNYDNKMGHVWMPAASLEVTMAHEEFEMETDGTDEDYDVKKEQIVKYYSPRHIECGGVAIKVELIYSSDPDVFAKYGKKNNPKSITNCFHIKMYFNTSRGGYFPTPYNIKLKMSYDEIEFKTDGSDEMYDKFKEKFINELLPKAAYDNFDKNISYKITLISSTDTETFERFGNF